MTKKTDSAGDRLRKAILAEFELTDPELELLAKAASVADLLDRVEGELAGAPLVEAGSRGQPVASPLIRSQIELGGHLVRLLEALALPLGDEDNEESRTTQQARKAAMVRWHGRSIR